MVQDGAMPATAVSLTSVLGRPGRYLVAAVFVASLVQGAATAGQPRAVTMQPLTMIGLGGATPTGSSQPFRPKTVSMAALTMIGISGSAASASQPFSAKTVQMQMLTMTGTRAGSAIKLQPGAANLLKLPNLGKTP